MSEQKSIVDPGFVHHRKFQTILQVQCTDIINNQIAKIPATVPEWQKFVHIDHIYTRYLLQFCKTFLRKSFKNTFFSTVYAGVNSKFWRLMLQKFGEL